MIMKKSKKLILTKDLKLVNENMDKGSEWITETLEEILYCCKNYSVKEKIRLIG